MLIRELSAWPPTLTDSRTFKVTSSASLPAILKRCGIYTIPGQSQPYLSLVVEYEGREWHATIQDEPVDLLQRVEATLRDQRGRPLMELGDLPVREADEMESRRSG